MDPLLTFLLVLVIGIVVGLLLQRVTGRGWLTRQLAGGRRADLTAALVGIAGAFIGFHIMALAGLISPGFVLIGALVGAIIVVWAWREVRF
ncbi:MAG TPA: transglycosylase [Devosia sp.]|nr:transglycosylase [Devosia sp.]